MTDFKRKIFAFGIVLGFVSPLTIIAAPNNAPIYDSRWYYDMGGGNLANSPKNGSLSMKLGLTGPARLSYSCGKIDARLSIQNMMNNLHNLQSAAIGAVNGAIASLPMYAFQRLSPGAYELFQTYLKKAEVEIAAALKTCEEYEAIAKEGGNPYEDWERLAKAENWKTELNSNSDGVVVKASVEKSGGRKGMTWIDGKKRGGVNQPPIELVNDLTRAGYNVHLNRAISSDNSINNDSRLGQAFATPADAANWAIEVLGDKIIATCGENDCPNKASKTGLGLLPQVDKEFTPVVDNLNKMVNNSVAPTYDELNAAGAPGVAVTRQVIDALKILPKFDQTVAVNRFAREIAMARTINKALLIRSLIMSGTTLPEVAEVPAKQARFIVAELSKQIEDLLFEAKVNRDLVSNSAQLLINNYQNSNLRSLAISPRPGLDPNPLKNGRVVTPTPVTK